MHPRTMTVTTTVLKNPNKITSSCVFSGVSVAVQEALQHVVEADEENWGRARGGLKLVFYLMCN